MPKNSASALFKEVQIVFFNVINIVLVQSTGLDDFTMSKIKKLLDVLRVMAVWCIP